MIVYFSGTGNSRYAAKLIAGAVGGELTDAGALIKAGRRAELRSDSPWVFVSPTYGWRIPRDIEAFIRNGAFSGDRRAYFVMTCGDDTGAACEKLRGLCCEKGLDFMGLASVVMPENYVAMFSVPDRGEAAAIIERAEPGMRRAAGLIAAGEPLPDKTVSFGDKFKTGIVNPLFYALCVNAKKFCSTDACVGCGKCAALCPKNTITMVSGRPVWGGGCTHCMACICSCPKKAIEYGRASLGKPRYRCPEYVPEK